MKTLATILLSAISILVPTTLFAFGATAGTDEYLVNIGFSNDQLSNKISTENRESFYLAEGVGRVDDPLGDVVDRTGTTSSIKQGWGDIEQAVVTKNDETKTWDVTVTFGETIPHAPSQKAQLFFLADTDGEKLNNDRDGFRMGTDAEFSIQTTPEHPWYVDYRWYNPDAEFWAINKESTMTFEIDEKKISLHIPFTEIPEELPPYWRVVMGLADGAATQIDVAPGVGFPPPVGETYPSTSFSSSFLTSIPSMWITWGIIGLIVGCGGYSAFAKKMKKG